MSRTAQIAQELRIARICRQNITKVQHPSARAACIETHKTCIATARFLRLN